MPYGRKNKTYFPRFFFPRFAKPILTKDQDAKDLTKTERKQNKKEFFFFVVFP